MRRELDSDQIVELIRRTPGITPIDREIARMKLVDDLLDVEISAAKGIHYSRSSVTRHLHKVIPLIEYRYLKDKAGA